MSAIVLLLVLPSCSWLLVLPRCACQLGLPRCSCQLGSPIADISFMLRSCSCYLSLFTCPCQLCLQYLYDNLQFSLPICSSHLLYIYISILAIQLSINTCTSYPTLPICFWQLSAICSGQPLFIYHYPSFLISSRQLSLPVCCSCQLSRTICYCQLSLRFTQLLM